MTTQETTALAVWKPDEAEMDLYRRQFAPQTTTPDEWEIFLETCRAYKVSPIRKQIYIVGRWSNEAKRMVNTPQISIGGLRLLALRTGQFAGTTEPQWGDEEGSWYTLWPKKLGTHPYAARIGVYRTGFREPVWGVAYFHEMAQKKKDGTYTKFWNDMGIHMILKCALADAIRGAFEEECGGVYLHEEMNQADADATVISVIPEVDTNDQSTNDALRQTASRVQPTNSTTKPTTARPTVQPTTNGATSAKPPVSQPTTNNGTTKTSSPNETHKSSDIKPVEGQSEGFTQNSQEPVKTMKQKIDELYRSAEKRGIVASLIDWQSIKIDAFGTMVADEAIKDEARYETLKREVIKQARSKKTEVIAK